MIIIAGYLDVDPSDREAYVTECIPVVEAAHSAAGCLAFSLTPDSVNPARICVFERWNSEEELMAFRGSGPSDDQQTAIVGAEVKRYHISSVGDA